MNNKVIVVSKLPWLPLKLRKFFPPLAAVYYCIDSHSDLIYIGQSKNVKQRFAQHHLIKDFEALKGLRVHFYFVPEYELSMIETIERRAIRALEPLLNQR